MLYEKIKIRGLNHYASVTGYFIDNSPEMDMKKKRPLILIVPGGGYWMTSDREAEPIALKCLGAGYHAAVIRYSVFPARFPEALVQLAKTVAWFRKNSGKYGIEEGKIITLGFSAGAHLAASLGVFRKEGWLRDLLLGKMPSDSVVSNYMDEIKIKHLDRETLEGKNADFPNDDYREVNISLRSDEIPEYISPWKQVLSYPVITSGEYAHKDSFRNVTGLEEGEAPDIWKKLSLEFSVSQDTVPTFIWHTFADCDVPVENSFLFAEALHRAKVPAELHIYSKGRHGLSLGTEDVMAGKDRTDVRNIDKLPEPIVQSWFELMIRWLKYA